MSNKYNPIHAAAYGIVTGFILFAAMVARSDSWWPSSAISDLGLKILILMSVVFAIAAVMRNRLVERNLRRAVERRISENRHLYRS
jgi:hypothetical protein